MVTRNLFVPFPSPHKLTELTITRTPGGCFITNSYVNQLDDEAVANWPKMGSDVEVNQVTGPRPL